jgi:hypothetical protein
MQEPDTKTFEELVKKHGTSWIVKQLQTAFAVRSVAWNCRLPGTSEGVTDVRVCVLWRQAAEQTGRTASPRPAHQQAPHL